MKKLLMVVLLASATTALAAKDSLVSVDLNNAPWRMALKPEFQFSKIEDKFAGLAGVQLGPQLAETVYFGVGAYGLVNNVTPDDPKAKLGAFDFWYAGFTADYTFFSDKLLHGSINALIGGGKVSPADYESANVFVATPGISLMVNITKQIEFGVGAGYRFVAGADQPTNSELSKPWASVFLRLNESY